MMRGRSIQDSRVLRRRVRARRALRPSSVRLLSAFLKIRRELGKPVEVFDAEELKRMLQSGEPDDAHYYLERFLPPGSEWSELCTTLFVHVGVFKILARVVAGGEDGDKVASLMLAKPINYDLEKTGPTGLQVMIAALHTDRTRGPMLWQKVKLEGVDRIMDLVARCPELQGEVRVALPWDATTNRNSAKYKRLSGCPRRCRRTTNHAPAGLLIHAFLRKRLLLIQGNKHSARSRNSTSQCATPYVEMVQIAPQPAVLEGVSHAPVVCHTPHIMTSQHKNSGIFSSATNAATSGDQGANPTVSEKQVISPLDSI